MYYILEGQDKIGPLSMEELKEHKVELKTEIWHEGLPHWVQVRDLPEVVSALQLKVEEKSPSMNGWMIINIAIQFVVTLSMHFRLTEEFSGDDGFYTIMMSILIGFMILNIVSIVVLFQRKYRLAKVLSIISCIIFVPIGLVGVVGMNKAIEKVS